MMLETQNESSERRDAADESLKKARQLTNEAISMTREKSSNNEELNKKIADVLNIFALPVKWYQQGKIDPAAIIKGLDREIEERSHVVNSPIFPHKDSAVELAIEASGGRVLNAVYYSEYKSPQPVGQPILQPPTCVKMFEPSIHLQERFMLFSKGGAAAKFVSNMESTSINAGFAVKGVSFLAEVESSFGIRRENSSEYNMRSTCDNLSVLKYEAITKKEFQIEEDKMRLTEPARRHALNIGKTGRHADDARSFMRLYGSHYPIGVHKLGGIFYSIADAESYTRIETTQFAKEAVTKLESQISAGYLGAGFEAKGNVSASSKEAEEGEQQEESVFYRFSKQVIGPGASNPQTFRQLLEYNSTWAIIDRGPPEGYVPVWQLLRQEGKEYQTAAEKLKQIWGQDEEERKKIWKMKIRTERDERDMQQVKKDLLKIREEFLGRRYRIGKSYRPVNAKLKIEKDWLEHKDAYDQAIDFIMEDPYCRICKIVYWWHICGGGYSLMCWEVPRETKFLQFDTISGGHVLFFSETCFQWKDDVPLRG
ncbi:uncharacterized protein LOC114523491 [Dendronephthya gigantea]|uniref:uncharacterized protein LOC114523491 n=1 Tax=Dendronephthya gigantea TaxID=151771 RepID=UPI00106BE548|nr:uncharacterized protein LOC114523491 [Dendronephthya gigantea]XP_028400235.1 uncharacterized protein LOC114523491 [Dendronephthya gigantea]XP_028400236.1 uncharacterized protein LOC114523491 [Dendronephthya gigantea]